jgi:uncharacterized protein with ACT and thioredoxin-like domain
MATTNTPTPNPSHRAQSAAEKMKTKTIHKQIGARMVRTEIYGERIAFVMGEGVQTAQLDDGNPDESTMTIM